VTAVVTEIVATVSVVQQVDVDSNGNTYATETLTTESSPAITDEHAATTTTESPGIVSPASTVVGGVGGGAGASQASQSLLSDQGITSASATISIPTHFPTLILSSNSTSCKSIGQLRG
jgi:hypothetical protein